MTDRDEARASETSSPIIDVSVVLPAYNEERTIEETVRTTLSTLSTFLPSDAFEVIVAEDGCDDRTPEIADELAAEDSRVRHFHSDVRLGRGGALERAFAAANGETLVYFDTDLATDMSHLEELVERVRSGDYDVATGSRWMSGHRADRPAKRGVPSQVYNTLVRLFLRSNLRDHQCGFKAFSREAFDDLSGEVEDNHWFWDTELLVRAQRKGYRVAEFPVDWTPKGDTKVDLVRDIFGMGSQILRTWWQLSVQPRITRRVTMVVGVLLTVLALLLMTQYINVGAVVSAIENTNPALVALAAFIYLFSWPIRGLRYRDILSELGFREKVGFLTGAIFISQTGNLVFPARLGDGVRAYVVKARRGIPYPSGFASLAAERVFDLLSLVVLGGTVFVGLVVTGQTSEIVAALSRTSPGGPIDPEAVRIATGVAAFVGLAAIAAVAVIVASARSDRNLIRPAIRRISNDSYADYVAAVVERFVGDLQRVAGTSGAFTRVGIASLLIWSIDVVTAFVVLLAFDVQGHVQSSQPLVWLAIVSFFAVSVGNLAKVLPLSPGGIGLYEAAFGILLFGLTGISPELAVAAAVLDHTVKNIITMLGGIGSMASLNVSLTTAVDEAGDVTEHGEMREAAESVQD